MRSRSVLPVALRCRALIAFASHFLIEHNRPLADRPVWGAVSDLRMDGLAAARRLDAQLELHSYA